MHHRVCVLPCVLQIYAEYREAMIHLYREDPARTLTPTEARLRLQGDTTTIHRQERGRCRAHVPPCRNTVLCASTSCICMKQAPTAKSF